MLRFFFAFRLCYSLGDVWSHWFYHTGWLVALLSVIARMYFDRDYKYGNRTAISAGRLRAILWPILVGYMIYHFFVALHSYWTNRLTNKLEGSELNQQAYTRFPSVLLKPLGHLS